jgi:cytochrome c oxidase subunit 3
MFTSHNFNNNYQKNEQHPFHLVSPSPWPIMTSLSLFSLVLSFIMYFHYFKNGVFYIILSLTILLFYLFRWFSDIIEESTYEGFHTKKVRDGIRLGMCLFIASEIMFFFSFFWAFFHGSLAPSIDIGCIWPPTGIFSLDPWGLPLLNTIILLSSGVTITWSHRAVLSGNWLNMTNGLIATISYGIIFTCIQYYEYTIAPFSMNDGIFGSLFYMLTGFHGIHILIGTLFLFICLLRHLKLHFTTNHHIGFECAIWYWHFVDVVWLFLFVIIYVWGA